VEYVSFGRAGIKVSRLALGLGLRGQSDETAAEQLTYAALDSGINLFDCANVYGLMDDRAYAGRSEVILGRALKRRRDEVVITSKVWQRHRQWPQRCRRLALPHHARRRKVLAATRHRPDRHLPPPRL